MCVSLKNTSISMLLPVWWTLALWVRTFSVTDQTSTIHTAFSMSVDAHTPTHMRSIVVIRDGNRKRFTQHLSLKLCSDRKQSKSPISAFIFPKQPIYWANTTERLRVFMKWIHKALWCKRFAQVEKDSTCTYGSFYFQFMPAWISIKLHLSIDFVYNHAASYNSLCVLPEDTVSVLFCLLEGQLVVSFFMMIRAEVILTASEYMYMSVCAKPTHLHSYRINMR